MHGPHVWVAPVGDDHGADAGPGTCCRSSRCRTRRAACNHDPHSRRNLRGGGAQGVGSEGLEAASENEATPGENPADGEASLEDEAPAIEDPVAEEPTEGEESSALDGASEEVSEPVDATEPEAEELGEKAAAPEAAELEATEPEADGEEPAPEVADEVEDTEAPDLDTGMSVSARRATAGDTLEFSLRVSDDSGGRVVGWIYLRNAETGQERDMRVDNSVWGSPEVAYGDEATGSLGVTDGFDPGVWVATRVYLFDDNGHSVTYYDPAYAPSWGDYPTADLSALSFEVYGTAGDSEAPVLGAVSVSVKRVAAGGSVTMTLKTEGHDVAEAAIVYRAPQSGDSVPVPLSAASEGVMAGSMAITDDTELGTWEAKAIEWTNSEGEERTVTNTALSGADPQDAGIMLLAAGGEQDVLAGDLADLSGLTFEVVRPEELNPTPEQPDPPSEPSEPEQPSVPETPSEPEQPTVPSTPVIPAPAPVKPAQPGIAQTGDETFSAAPAVVAGGVLLVLAGALFAVVRRGARR